jgi:hypothetical protein
LKDKFQHIEHGHASYRHRHNGVLVLRSITGLGEELKRLNFPVVTEFCWGDPCLRLQGIPTLVFESPRDPKLVKREQQWLVVVKEKLLRCQRLLARMSFRDNSPSATFVSSPAHDDCAICQFDGADGGVDWVENESSTLFDVDDSSSKKRAVDNSALVECFPISKTQKIVDFIHFDDQRGKQYRLLQPVFCGLGYHKYPGVILCNPTMFGIALTKKLARNKSKAADNSLFVLLLDGKQSGTFVYFTSYDVQLGKVACARSGFAHFSALSNSQRLYFQLSSLPVLQLSIV